MIRNNLVLTKLKEFSLDIPSANGLKRGYTTGTCAAAASQAALTLLLVNKKVSSVPVILPIGTNYSNNDWNNRQFIQIPVQNVEWLDNYTTLASVLKDAGDDPDRTHGATIFAKVQNNHLNHIRFIAGKGVGIVTKPGINLPVGAAAINPTPRKMIQQALQKILNETGLPTDEQGYDITIGCINGENIAKHTFNPRLGIEGGISILGTSGIVEPMSLSSWIASIEVYLKVALADNTTEIALLPGKIARSFVKEQLHLPTHKTIEIANFLGEALDFTESILDLQHRRLKKLWLLGHPGKLAKVLDGSWNTHSSKSKMAMNNIAKIAEQINLPKQLISSIQQASTVESVIQQLKDQADGKKLWTRIEQQISKLAKQRVPAADSVDVRLFDFQGNPLGIDA